MADNETAAMDQLNHTRIEAQLDKSTCRVCIGATEHVMKKGTYQVRERGRNIGISFQELFHKIRYQQTTGRYIVLYPLKITIVEIRK